MGYIGLTIFMIGDDVEQAWGLPFYAVRGIGYLLFAYSFLMWKNDNTPGHRRTALLFARRRRRIRHLCRIVYSECCTDALPENAG